MANTMTTVFTTKEQVEQEVAKLRVDPRYLSLSLPPTNENICKNYNRALALVFDMPCDFIWGIDCGYLEGDPKTIIDHIRNEDILPWMPKIKANKPHEKFKTFWNSYEMLTAEEVDYSAISMVWLYLFEPRGINHYACDIFLYAAKHNGELEHPEIASARNEFRDYIRTRYASAELYYHRILSFLIKEDDYMFEYVDLKKANERLWNRSPLTSEASMKRSVSSA